MLPFVPHHRRKNGRVSIGRGTRLVITAGGASMSGGFVATFIRSARVIGLSLALLMIPRLALAQAPWERAANNLATTFTGPLARSLALVAIVIGGLMFMFGEAGAKRQISGIVFGGGLALFAAQFLLWLF
jgi:type IV secretory pathway VirB2 component (pilin)